MTAEQNNDCVDTAKKRRIEATMHAFEDPTSYHTRRGKKGQTFSTSILTQQTNAHISYYPEVATSSALERRMMCNTQGR